MKLICALALICTTAQAESVVAARTLPAQTVLSEADLMLVDAEIAGALVDPAMALGQQLRVTLYAGRPIRPQDIASPALVERNATVRLVFSRGGLTILAEGRALARGAEGEVVRVMNLASKTTVSGRVAPDGSIIVGD